MGRAALQVLGLPNWMRENTFVEEHVGEDAFQLVDSGRGAEVAARWRALAKEML